MRDRHLSLEELVDLIEGTLSSDRATHAHRCDGCSRRVEEVRAAANAAREVEVPEPSPLFWDHFTARVRDAVAADPATSGRPEAWRHARPGFALTAAMALVAIITGVVMFRSAVSDSPRESAPAVASRTPEGEAGARPRGPLDDEDPEWALVLQLVAEFNWSAADEMGLVLGDATIDRAVSELSPAERRELVRLLEVEIKDLL